MKLMTDEQILDEYIGRFGPGQRARCVESMMLMDGNYLRTSDPSKVIAEVGKMMRKLLEG